MKLHNHETGRCDAPGPEVGIDIVATGPAGVRAAWIPEVGELAVGKTCLG